MPWDRLSDKISGVNICGGVGKVAVLTGELGWFGAGSGVLRDQHHASRLPVNIAPEIRDSQSIEVIPWYT